jgi:hypothetical protein
MADEEIINAPATAPAAISLAIGLSPFRIICLLFILYSFL